MPNQHLTDMRKLASRTEREEVIKKIPFQQMIEIVLATRRAIMDRVEENIDPSLPLLFLIGNTGSGKSTTLCYLRGDEMKRCGNDYESANNQTYIGHGAQSQTFLPNIERLEDRILVDFPGFEDTHGSLIVLGIELAFKALVRKYNPQILLLESILNAQEARGARICDLSQTLNRLLENPKKACILGLTKYSKLFEVQAIKNIEKEQQQLVAFEEIRLSDEEIERDAKISILEEMIPDIDELELQALLKAKREAEKHPPRVDTKKLKLQEEAAIKKLKLQKSVVKKEKTILSQSGFRRIIQFRDLENKGTLPFMFNQLTMATADAAQVKKSPQLYKKHRELIKQQFQEDFKKPTSRNSKQNVPNFSDFESLKKAIEERSLLAAVSSPEIGEFFHLPDVDPKLASELDQELSKGCVSSYKKSIRTIPFKALQNFLEQKKPTPEINAFLQELNDLKSSLHGIEGTSADVFDRWLDGGNRLTDKTAEDVFQLPGWVTALSYIDTTIPKNLYSLSAQSVLNNSKKSISTEELEKATKEIKQVRAVLYNLLDLNKFIVHEKYCKSRSVKDIRTEGTRQNQDSTGSISLFHPNQSADQRESNDIPSSHLSANESCLTEIQREKIETLISKLSREIKSGWPYPNKLLKQDKINGLNHILTEARTSQDLAAIINDAKEKFPQMTNGKISTRTADLLTELTVEVMLKSLVSWT